MSAATTKFFSSLLVFFSEKRNRRLFYLVVISLIALCEFMFSGLARRTFIFYSMIDGKSVIENRMVYQSMDRETDIRRYLEEVLLGPAEKDSAPLFHRETQLNSFLYRDGSVYADLTEHAVLPNGENHDVFRSLVTVNKGIRRNFPKVRDVRLFIGGNEVFYEEFRRIFANSADNRKTAP